MRACSVPTRVARPLPGPKLSQTVRGSHPFGRSHRAWADTSSSHEAAPNEVAASSAEPTVVGPRHHDRQQGGGRRGGAWLRFLLPVRLEQGKEYSDEAPLGHDDS